MTDPSSANGACQHCGMPVLIGTVVCPVCNEVNDPPVRETEPVRYGSCRHCGMRVPVGTTLCDICGETNDPPVEELEPEPDLPCPHCGMPISRALAERTHECPVCGEDPLPRDPLDHLPGDAPAPPAQPLRPEEQGIVAETLAGLAGAGVAVGSSYSVTGARIDDDGNTRVEITIPVGADGQPLPPISARQGEGAAVALLVIEATATHKHARLVAVDSNRIYRSGSAWTNSGAFAGFIDDGRFVLPQPKRGRGRTVAAVVGVVFVAGAGLLLVLGGGDDDTTSAPREAGADEGTGDGSRGPDVGTVSTAPDDLAVATPPVDGLPWAAFKTQDITPPPQPIQPWPVGHRYQGTFTVTASCDDDGCTYATPMETGAAIVVGTLRDAPWERRGDTWHLETVADLQSSNTGGLQCVYHRTMAWTITPTESTWDGEQWVMSAGRGELVDEQHLDPALSAAAMAEQLCPPYAEASRWDAFVATDARRLPATAP